MFEVFRKYLPNGRKAKARLKLFQCRFSGIQTGGNKNTSLSDFRAVESIQKTGIRIIILRRIRRI